MPTKSTTKRRRTRNNVVPFPAQPALPTSAGKLQDMIRQWIKLNDPAAPLLDAAAVERHIFHLTKRMAATRGSLWNGYIKALEAWERIGDLNGFGATSNPNDRLIYDLLHSALIDLYGYMNPDYRAEMDADDAMRIAAFGWPGGNVVEFTRRAS